MPDILTIATCQHPVFADIVHFSECNISGYAGEEFTNIDKARNVELLNALEQVCHLAGREGIWVILGSHHFEDGMKKPYNSLYVINDHGEIIIF